MKSEDEELQDQVHDIVEELGLSEDEVLELIQRVEDAEGNVNFNELKRTLEGMLRESRMG